MKYSPFSKELQDLNENELMKLIDNSISEGWYIEFKSDIPRKTEKIDSLKIAKSISAFANTKGGWLFYGVASNEKNIATSLCGFDIKKYNNICDQISQLISENIFPKPIFHFKTVELANENDILIIQIEEGPTPPYITSQGIIYQRENNQSNPIKDRYIIEKLNDKAENYRAAIERFSNVENFGETKGQSESNQSYLELYLFPTPFNEYKFQNFYSSDFFKDVADRFYNGVNFSFEGVENPVTLGLRFNSIYSSEESLIVRPLYEGNHIYKGTTVELFRNGSLKLLVPIKEFSLNNVPEEYKESSVIEYLKQTHLPDYKTIDYEQDDWHLDLNEGPSTSEFADYIKMIDGVELIFTVLIVTTIYSNLLIDNGFDKRNSIGFRAKITSMWRKFIFFDDKDYLDKIKLYNVPISPKDKLEIPSFINGNHYEVNIEQGDSFFSIARFILEGIGLPDSSGIDFTEIMLKMGERFK